MEVRRAEAADLAGVRAIAGSYGNLEDWRRRPDSLDFELERGGLWVALDADGGGVAGFAGVLTDGGYAHLADAFVRRDALGRGIGRALLDAAFADDGSTRVTFASPDPRALPLYARAGLQPLAPVLYLDGTLAGGGEAERVEPTDLTARDAGASGRERPAALHLLARAGAYGLLAGEHAYAIVRPAGDGARLGPAAGDAAELLAFAAAASAAHGSVHLSLPGPHPALRALLDGGLRITDADTYMASRAGVHDLARYVPDSDLG